MNDFERKLRDTPLRPPPAALRGEILAALPANQPAASTQSDRLPAPPRLMKTKTIFAIGFALASLTTLLAVGVVGVNIRGRSAWDVYAEEAKQRGVKMSLSELLPPPVPDAENFAAVPLFANLFSDDEAVRTAAQNALAIPKPDVSQYVGKTREPRLTDLAAWQAAFVKSGDLPAARADPATDVLEGIVHHCGPALAELAEAERRPHAVFPVKWEQGFAALLPHLSLMQSAASIHRIRAAAHLARKENAAAFEEFQGMLRLVRALESEPTLIAGLVRISALKMASGVAWEGLVQDRWTSAELATIQRDLTPFNVLADFRFSLASERAGMNDTLNRMRGGEVPFPTTSELSLTGNNSASQIGLRAISVFAGVLNYNQIAINRYHDESLSRIDAEGARFRESGSADAMLQDIESSWPKSVFYSLFRVTVPLVRDVEKNFLFAHTTLQLTRLACALERCRMAEGAYPETLDALVPKYIEALPHDVIDGQPLRYRRTDDGRFLLYSVGMNAKDDGGASGGKTSASEQLDWAWRWPEP